MRRIAGGCAHVLAPTPSTDPRPPDPARPLAVYRQLARRGAPLAIDALCDLRADAAALVRLYAPTMQVASHTARDSTAARVWASVVDACDEALRLIDETGDRELARAAMRRLVVGIALEDR